MGEALRRAVIVPRVSSVKQADEGTSLDNQELHCLRKATEIGATIHAVYRDEGVSGALYLTREGIQKALADIENGRANVLITYKLDRAGRDVDVLRDIRRRVEQAGAELVFADGVQFAKNATGNLMYTQLSAFAEFERGLIRERTADGRRKRAEEGSQPCRSMKPYGYHIKTKADGHAGRYPEASEGHYIVVEEQARWVRRIFQRCAEGSSLNEICRDLNDLGVATPRGGRSWKPPTIRFILNNHVYRGKATSHRYQVRHDERRVTERGMKRESYVRTRPVEQWLLIDVPAIVEPAVWDACQARLGENRAILGGRPKDAYLLTGLLRCPECGRTMCGDGRQATYRYYTCRRRGDHEPGVSVRADWAEAVFLEAFSAALRQPEAIAAAFAAWSAVRDRDVPVDDVESLARSIESLQREEDIAVRLQIDAVSRGTDPGVYERRLRELSSQREHLDRRLAEARRAQSMAAGLGREEAENVVVTAEKCIEQVAKVLTADPDEVSNQEKKQAIAGFVKELYPVDEGIAAVLKPLAVNTITGEAIKNVTTFCLPR